MPHQPLTTGALSTHLLLYICIVGMEHSHWYQIYRENRWWCYCKRLHTPPTQHQPLPYHTPYPPIS